MTSPARPLGAFALRTLALAASAVALGSLASDAPAAGGEPFSLDAQALLSPAGTALTLRVEGPTVPSRLENVQVKTAGSATRNYFDVAAPAGVAKLDLLWPDRGDRLELHVHVKDGPQHNLEAEATVLRRPDLTVTEISVPADVVRTRTFGVTTTVAEVGGDVGATAQVALFDGAGTTPLAESAVTVVPGGTARASFAVTLKTPGDHHLRAVVSGSTPSEWSDAPNTRERELYVNHYGENGVVATDHELATQIGAEVLRRGGNAFDAAAAVQFALNVVQPHFSGIGGGSNIVIRDGETGEVFAIDARETAPAATTPTTYAGLTAGDVRPNGFAVGVPGTLRAVEYLLERWGTTTLAEALQPATELAEEGFPVGHHLAREIPIALPRFQPETKQVFLRADGTPLVQGDLLRQPDLAKTFRLLALDGVRAFYDGEISQAVVAAQQRANTASRAGTMTLDDLRAYAIEVERPLSLRYRGYDVLAPGPSTNGGVVLLESLGLIREFLADPRNGGYAWGFATRNSMHVFIEAMRLAFADRDFWLGDERFTDVPVPGLLHPDYLRARSALIGRETVMCNPVRPGDPLPYVEAEAAEEDPEAAGHTTHFSIIDRWGNAVAMTSTLRDAFGTGIMVPGYGFMLNDTLGLFNLTPRANPATGNPGANDAAGGKRPMGNVAPTLVLRDGEPYAGTGSFGSGFIPSIVLNVVLNILEYDLPLQQAVDAPRLWTQSPTGAAQLNFGLDHLITPLREMGHVGPAFGGCADNMNRTPLPPLLNVGSAGSFGVDLQSFALAGGVDSARFPDASTVVVERT
ncbi:MAG TPA: gamma-glutamyltransferase [Gaiellaceae bacterium]|nr:gamma-glutamyltransferase [Gaiellaceae bacterium]